MVQLETVHNYVGIRQMRMYGLQLEFDKKAQSKVGSLDNAKHKATGGNVKVRTSFTPYRQLSSRACLPRPLSSGYYFGKGLEGKSCGPFEYQDDLYRKPDSKFSNQQNENHKTRF